MNLKAITEEEASHELARLQGALDELRSEFDRRDRRGDCDTSDLTKEITWLRSQQRAIAADFGPSTAARLLEGLG